MNLLVTNAANSAAYSIVRALRPYSEKIVVTMPGDTLIASLGTHTAYSRYVDKRYRTPVASKDWLSGRIQPNNTELEEAYVRRIETICQREAIDTLYPSSDPLVYIFAKNKARFAQQGVTVVGPDYDMLRIPHDKYETILAAQKAGFDTPHTILPDDEDHVRRITREFGPPWVVKPRFTVGSKGTSFVTDSDALPHVWTDTARLRGKPLVQEFIPGNRRQNLCVVAGRDSQLLSLVCPETIRITLRVHRNSTIAATASSQTPCRPHIEKLLADLGWWGTLTIQVKHDARDGKAKLLEINPRPGEVLWHRTEAGFNEPLLCVQLARDETPPPVNSYPDGALLLDPISDLTIFPFELLDLLVFKVRTGLLGKQPVDAFNTPLSLSRRIASYNNAYFNRRRKILNPHTRYLLDDPLACAAWHLMVLKYRIARVKMLGI